MMKTTRIGFLATGDEICGGDVVNTNTATIARLLIDNHWEIGQTLSVNDEKEELLSSLEYLNQEHDLIITIGGLGPTSDDLTRFAISRFVGEDLVFFVESWDRICNRFEHCLNLSVPEDNRQQALFPKSAVILPNAIGSADGCYVKYNNKHIFMLPGPPKECLTMFSNHILPKLNSLSLTKSPLRLLKWRLFGVSESHIADRLKKILTDPSLKVGYRIDYPYLDCKIWVDQNKNTTLLEKQIELAIGEHCISANNQDASQACHDLIKTKKQVISITDQATFGFLQSQITSHDTWAYLHFVNDKQPKQFPHLHIEGLDDFWQHDPLKRDKNSPAETELVLTWQLDEKTKPITVNKTIAIRHRFVIRYCVEWICYQLILFAV